jgi:hypothetical protein
MVSTAGQHNADTGVIRHCQNLLYEMHLMVLKAVGCRNVL